MKQQKSNAVRKSNIIKWQDLLLQSISEHREKQIKVDEMQFSQEINKIQIDAIKVKKRNDQAPSLSQTGNFA